MTTGSEKNAVCELFLISCMLIISSSYCLEPVSTSALVGGLVLTAGYAGYDYVRCRYYECCDDKWIRTDTVALEHDLKARLHGQHLASFIMSRAIRGHLRKKNPSKALVMAFHGWTGSGKNHASKIIIDSLYKQGKKSKFVHWYISTNRFPHIDEVERYKDELRREIAMHTKLCGRSLFIFDEIDKMPPGVIDALKPFIDYHEEVEGVDYRRNIFIFLSNTGGSEISKVAYQFWLKGEDRESITMKDIEPLVNKGAFNEKGGLQHSEIIEKNLIDIYVPFLPLEKTHVRLCIRDELYGRSVYAPNPEIINMVVDQLQYYPPDLEVYSKSGCKKIEKKLDVFGSDDDDDDNINEMWD